MSCVSSPPRVSSRWSPADLDRQRLVVRGLALRTDLDLRRLEAARNRLVADPGFGFGKTPEHNLALLKRLPEFAGLGVPLLAGWSRKSSLGRITGRDTGERLAGSLAAALLALLGGARILRVHDVKETRDAVLVFEAWRKA